MSKPLFTALADAEPEESGQFAIFLGKPVQTPAFAPQKHLVFENIDEQALNRIALLNPRLMAQGLALITSSREYARNPENVLRAQKLIAYIFVKHVELPLSITRVPDVYGLRSEELPPEYLHLLHRFRNTHLHLRHCLADKLREVKIGLPCLILLPGPSLRLVLRDLPELAKRYLIVTISRVLPYLREAGVEPDVLVQLDTVPMQEDFHRASDAFPRTVLLSLSFAPIANFAHHFRNLFFLDSFDLSLLANPARIRESWLSSMLACLGVAEALHAPLALLAGVDLRNMGSDVYCGKDADYGLLPLQDKPMLCHDGLVVETQDAKGRQAVTSLQYFATAAEAEIYARGIGKEQGTLFRNLSPWSLLSPEEFPQSGLEEALEAEPIDKGEFLRKADQAAASRETINFNAVLKRYEQDLQVLEQSRELFTLLSLTDQEGIEDHPCFQYVKHNFAWFRSSAKKNQAHMASNLAQELCRAARFARNLAALHCLAEKNKSVPVFCLAEEEACLRRVLEGFRPGWKWRFMGIESLDASRGLPSSGGIRLGNLQDWLNHQSAALLAPGIARDFAYVLNLCGLDNLLKIEDIPGLAAQLENPGL